MKFVPNRPYSDPEKAARKIVEIANSVEVVQDGRIYVELINGPFLFREKGTPAEYKAGLVSKHCESSYRGGRSDRWVKVKNQSHPAFSRVMDQS